MTVTQIESEPERAAKSDFSLSSTAAYRFRTVEITNQAAVESVLLGAQLRGWLSEREKEFLNNLSTDRVVTFLVRGIEYLHPEDVELFPSQVIETAMRQGGEAFFSHRYRADSSNVDGYTIITALINSLEQKPLMLGIFGPDPLINHPEIQEKFYRLVSQFRQAYGRVKDIAHELVERQESNIPFIVVNRSSGRVVSINNAAEKLFGESQRNLVGLEFGELKPMLTPILTTHKLKITNVNKGDLYLSVVTIQPCRTSSDRGNRGVVESFVSSLQSKSASLTATAKELETLSEKTMSEDIATLSHKVAKEACELNLYSGKLHLLLTYDRLTPEPIDLEKELRQVVDSVVAQIKQERRIEIVNEMVNLEVQAPSGTYRHLFESILMSHFFVSDMPGSTNISLQKHPTGKQLIIAFETDTYPTQADKALSSEWVNYAGRLAAQLGVRLVNKQSVQDYKLVTMLTVNL